MSVAWGAPKKLSDFFLFEPVCVDLDVLVPLSRQIVLWKDCLHRTLVNAKSTINTCLGIDVELIDRLVLLTFLRWMNAVDGTNFDARRVLGSDAWLRNDVRHSRKILSSSGKTCPKRTESRHRCRLSVQIIQSMRLSGSS